MATAIISISSCITASADQLPNGAIQGLPEGLTAIDAEGNIINSQTGEFFFHVENMTPFEIYTKEISIANLQETYSYHIYMYAEPVSKNGEIDLENDCLSWMSLDDQEVFRGKVTGESTVSGASNIDQAHPLDLGLYNPGDTHTLKVSTQWTSVGSGGPIDNGEIEISKEGTKVIREGSGIDNIRGEVTYKWVFYASAEEPDSSRPNTDTGILRDTPLLVSIGAGLLVSVIVLFIIIKKKEKNDNQNNA